MIIDIKPNNFEAYLLLHKGSQAFARAEQQGMRIDMDYAEKKSKQLAKKIQLLEDKFRRTKLYKHWDRTTRGKPNINSNAQLSYFLYNTKKIKPAKFTITGKGSTDEDALKQLNIPEINILLKARKLKKIKDTYLQAFIREQVNGYIHPFYNLHTVRTYRSSSDKPNFQNIPKRDKEAMRICRKAIYPRPGYQLFAADFGSLEVRIAACYHQDPTMLKYIKDPTTDMHGDMAKQIFKISNFNKEIPEHGVIRAAVKNGFVFPQFYGDYYKNNALSMACEWGELPERKWKSGQGILLNEGTLSDHMIANGIKSIDQFIEHVKDIEHDFWYNRFPIYRKWKEKWWKNYQRTGRIELLTGFTCSGILGKNDAINWPVQGAAFHCLLWSFIRLDEIMRAKGWKSRLIGQIHDEIIFDVHPDELYEVALNVKLVTTGDLPRAWGWINVPLEVEAEVAGIDESWADMKPYKLPTKLN